jgi:hypothetical protein
VILPILLLLACILAILGILGIIYVEWRGIRRFDARCQTVAWRAARILEISDLPDTDRVQAQGWLTALEALEHRTWLLVIPIEWSELLELIEAQSAEVWARVYPETP